jgi:hypothetical protein
MEADNVAETLGMRTKFVVFNNFDNSLATVDSDYVFSAITVVPPVVINL